MKNKFNFLQTGGVPLTNDLMNLIEEAYSIFEVLADVAGDKTILAGCAVNGSNVSPGIVAIAGKLYYFEGGLATSTVFISKQEVPKTFQDQTNKVLIEIFSVKFGNSTPGNVFLWADFVRLDNLKDLKIKVDAAATQAQISALITEINLLKLKTAAIVNGGVIWPWRRPASEIPAGWKECIDFRGKTIFGRDPNDSTFANLGNSIGTKTKTITKQNIPDYTIVFYGGTNSGQYGVGNDLSTVLWNGKAATWEHDHTYGINSGGSGVALDVLNPGRIVNFIEPDLP